MIPLLQYLTFVGALNDSFTTPWIRNPRPELQNAELWISVKTVHGGQLDLVLQSSPDTDQVTSVSTTNLNAVGETVTSITSKLGAYLRLKLTAAAATTGIIVSVWVLPKES